MCGIAGILTADSGAPVSLSLLRPMTEALAHRGPDGDGFHCEPGLGLGHRRLAIIDLSGGRQPMFNEDRSVVIVFNGEIYNHNALREELRAHGHEFCTRSDTEVIVHAWESWGTACLDRLSGQFAFALWDRKRQQLFLARDRLGEKPLYYARLGDGAVVFASELRALLVHPQVPRMLSPAAIDDYFAFGYVPDPDCIYAGIHKLPAAHYLLVQRGRPAAAQPYWRPRFASRRISAADAVAELREALRRSVASCLVADVPLGAFLSGGVDSSAVVAAMAELCADPVATFTIGFDDEADETPFAAAIARRYHTNHRTERVAAIDTIDAAREQARIYGEPFADSSSIPTYRVSVMARQNVTVALSGDAGDELFAGYRRYRWHRIAEAVRAHLPAAARRRLFGELARIYPKLDRAPRWLRAKTTLSEISLDSALGYYRTLCKVHDGERRRLFAPPLRHAVDGHDPARRIAGLMAEADTPNPVQQAQYADLKSYLPGDILVKVDRASMATSLEVRAPLLDHPFVEWALSLPPSLTLRRGMGKFILKRALEGRVPDANLYRAKQGFAAPLAERFRGRGAMRVRERLTGERMGDCGLFDMAALARLVEAHAGGADHSAAIWSLLVFEGFLAAGVAGPERPAREPGSARQAAA
ncbi:MAG TPA: XrtA/PEP-CTERM system amidotransferase [Stellaceae bacterium]|nr:XrtA/PEP-CTERM system amidotransferase [Stellaceae bacterium]